MGDTENNNILFKALLDIQDIKNKKKQAEKEFKDLRDGLSKIDLRTKTGRAQKETVANAPIEIAKYDMQILGLKKQVRDLTKETEEATRKFPGYAMSIMFFGMAMERTFSGIAKTGLQAFQDIAHSVMFNVTEVDKLNGSFKYLQYSIGSALEPLLATLIPIIDSVSEWVSDNEELVSTIVAAGVTLGAIFMVGGGGILALNGFGTLLDKLKQVPTTASEVFDSKKWAGFGRAVQEGVGLIMVGVGLMTAASSIKEFTEGTGEGTLKGALKLVGGTLEAFGGLTFIKGGKGGVWMMTIGFALDETARGTLIRDVINTISPIEAFILTVIDQMSYNVKAWWHLFATGEGSAGFDFKSAYQGNMAYIRQQAQDWQASANNAMYGTPSGGSMSFQPATLGGNSRSVVVNGNLNVTVDGNAIDVIDAITRAAGG